MWHEGKEAPPQNRVLKVEFSLSEGSLTRERTLYYVRGTWYEGDDVPCQWQKPERWRELNSDERLIIFTGAGATVDAALARYRTTLQRLYA